MSKENKGNKGWVWGAAIGAVVGSVTALLFAPKPGREIRKDIAEGARQVGEKTAEVAEKVSEQSVQLAGKVKDTTEGLIQDFQSWRATKEEDDKEKIVIVSSFSDENVAEEDVETAVIGISTEEDVVAEVEEEVVGAESSSDPEVESKA